MHPGAKAGARDPAPGRRPDRGGQDVGSNKDVDLLHVPGGEHALYRRMHYVVRRTWDYLVRHLHGVEPPAYRLGPLPALPASDLV
ncbi:hypothetical protein [Promicromonospora sp. NPDC057488]|uniref:hypothetical protein n=1 Tax=Promicromonospora sp. NPDC057488 TaxID=3346147 RepID=UPI003671B83E